MGNPELTGFASGARGGWFDEPDWDAPWHCGGVTLPNHARCETCSKWAGVCLDPNTGSRITRAEDRCMAWQQAAAHRERVASAEASWGPIEPWLPVFDGVNR